MKNTNTNSLLQPSAILAMMQNLRLIQHFDIHSLVIAEESNFVHFLNWKYFLSVWCDAGFLCDIPQ